MTTQTEAPIDGVERLERLVQECSKLTPRQIIREMRDYLVGVADHGDDEYTIIMPNLTRRGLVRELAMLRLGEELRRPMDAESRAEATA